MEIWKAPAEAGDVPKSRHERTRKQLKAVVRDFLKDSRTMVELAELHNQVLENQPDEWTVRRMIVSAAFQVLIEQGRRADSVWWMCHTDIIQSSYTEGDIEWTLAMSGDRDAGSLLDLLFAAYWTSDGITRVTLTKMILRAFPAMGNANDFSTSHIAQIQQWFEENRRRLKTNLGYLDTVSDFAVGVTDSCPPLIEILKDPIR